MGKIIYSGNRRTCDRRSNLIYLGPHILEVLSQTLLLRQQLSFRLFSFYRRPRRWSQKYKINQRYGNNIKSNQYGSCAEPLFKIGVHGEINIIPNHPEDKLMDNSANAFLTVVDEIVFTYWMITV